MHCADNGSTLATPTPPPDEVVMRQSDPMGLRQAWRRVCLIVRCLILNIPSDDVLFLLPSGQLSTLTTVPCELLSEHYATYYSNFLSSDLEKYHQGRFYLTFSSRSAFLYASFRSNYTCTFLQYTVKPELRIQCITFLSHYPYWLLRGSV